MVYARCNVGGAVQECVECDVHMGIYHSTVPMCVSVGVLVQVVGTPKASSSRNIQQLSIYCWQLYYRIITAYSCVWRGGHARPLKLMIWNTVFKDKRTKKSPCLSFSVSLCVLLLVLVFMCKALS